MVFSSLLFLFRFLPAVFIVYYVLIPVGCFLVRSGKKNHQGSFSDWFWHIPKWLLNLVLFIASLFFYAWGEPVYVVLILFSTLVDYFAGRAVSYCREQGYRRRAALCVAGSAVINLSLLGFFKYADFFLRIFHHLTGLSVRELHLALPIGISFYTFQTMSYTIDVYRGEAKVQKNLISFGAYVSLFPQLIAGPIVRYRDVDEQMDHRKESTALFGYGVLRFVSGLGKKVLIANQVGLLWDEIAALGNDSLTVLTAWLGVLAFTLQIYFDFSGYSDMAIGLGAMFGFSFPENFKYPYESKSITEFWRRWHISLGTWFREYVYIPMGGNRKGMGRQILNLAVVWLLTGLWHGAYFNFVLWGIYYGILLVLEKVVLGKVLEKLPSVFQHIYTMLIVMVGWAIFSWQDMSDGAYYMKTLFFMSHAGMADQKAWYLLSSNIVLLIAAAAGSLSLGYRLAARICAKKEDHARQILTDVLQMTYIAAVFLGSVAMLVNSSYNPFLYFRF